VGALQVDSDGTNSTAVCTTSYNQSANFASVLEAGKSVTGPLDSAHSSGVRCSPLCRRALRLGVVVTRPDAVVAVTSSLELPRCS
jgi:hypothetical protein